MNGSNGTSPTGTLVMPAAGQTTDPEVTLRAKRRRFSAEYKRGILREAEGLREPGQIGALLRREGLYASHLTAWRQQRAAGELASLAPKKRGRKPSATTQIARLEDEVARLRLRLQQAEAIVSAQKKLAEILGLDGSDQAASGSTVWSR